MKISCEICGIKTKLPAPEKWSSEKLTLCGKCQWDKIGNQLLRIFGFSTTEEAAGLFYIPPKTFTNLNNETAGRNLKLLARHVIRCAANLNSAQRREALETTCPWTKLSSRLTELFGLTNMSRIQSYFELSPSVISTLNSQKAGATITRLMKILINLAELLSERQKEEYLLNKNFFLF